MATAIEFEHVSKQYRLGLVSTKTLQNVLVYYTTLVKPLTLNKTEATLNLAQDLLRSLVKTM